MKPINQNNADSHRCRTSLQETTRPNPLATLAQRTSRLILALGVALYATSAAAQTQSWETVDDFDAPSASATKITTDSAGNIFVAGYIRDETSRLHAFVAKSSDGGATWETSADYPSVNDASAPNGSIAWFTAIASAHVDSSENHLVAAGRIKRVPFGSTFTGEWLIIRSKDAGTTWETVDEFSHPSYSQISGATFPGGVAVDSSGNIYVAGSAHEKIVTVKGKTTTTKTVNHWLIRKGLLTADGMVWTTVGDFAHPTGNDSEFSNTYPSGVACVGSNVFVVGGGGGSWVVRKSSNGGITWAVVDTFRFSTTDNSHAYGIAADSQGNVFVVGEGIGTVTSGRGNNTTIATHKYWIVRKGTGAGTSWATVDQFLYPIANGRAGAFAVTVAPNNDVHVTGYGSSAITPPRWITRQRSAVTGAWSTTDDFSMASNGSSQGGAITADPFGNLFAAGSASDSAGVGHGWLVRRKLAP